MDIWETGVKVLVVYPGVVDTPLFHLPDNDPFTAAVEFITVEEFVGATFDALDRGALEVYIPEYFKDFVTGKANNVEGFIAGTAEYMRQQAATGA
jgi:short-subunit dehydrogenase